MQSTTASAPALMPAAPAITFVAGGTFEFASSPVVFPPGETPLWATRVAPGVLQQLLAPRPGCVTYIGPVAFAPIEIYCRECGRPNAANGACYRCHPIPVERPR